jgi:hypothetical protein
MKIAYDDRPIQRYRLRRETKFTITPSGKAFRVLSSDLYKEKILATVREIACNAHDAHIEAGKGSLPIEVHLPNHLEPFFCVRDYGEGLAHRGYGDTPIPSINGLYSSYFASTKTLNNDVVGAFGLGSKSPLAYSDSFTVTCWRRKRKRTYTVFFDEEDAPSVTLMAVEPSDEPTGIEIKVAVRSTDFAEFQRRAEQVFRYFSPCPTVTGAAYFEVDSRRVVLAGDGYRLYSGMGLDKDAIRPKAVVGIVAYPLTPDRTKLDKKLASLLDSMIEIDFPIGSISMTPSREELSYDRRTVAAIEDRLRVIMARLTEDLQRHAASMTTEHAMRAFVADVKDYKVVFNCLPNGFHIGDKRIADNKLIFSFYSGLEGCSLYEFGYAKTGGRKMRRQNRDTETPHYFAKFTDRFYYDDLNGRTTRGRMETLRGRTPSNEAIYVLRVPQDRPDLLEAFKARIGGIECLPASSLPKADPRPKKAPPTIQQRAHKAGRPRRYSDPSNVTSYYLRQRNAFKNELADVSDQYLREGGFFIPAIAGVPQSPDGKPLTMMKVGETLESMRDLGVFNNQRANVMFITPEQMELYFEYQVVPDIGEWRNLWDHVNPLVLKSCKENNWGDAIAIAEMLRVINSTPAGQDPKTLKRLYETFGPDHEIGRFWQEFMAVKEAYTDAAETMQKMLSFYDFGPRHGEVYKVFGPRPLTKMWWALVEKYPLFKYMLRSSNHDYQRVDENVINDHIEYVRTTDMLRKEQVSA